MACTGAGPRGWQSSRAGMAGAHCTGARRGQLSCRGRNSLLPGRGSAVQRPLPAAVASRRGAPQGDGRALVAQGAALAGAGPVAGRKVARLAAAGARRGEQAAVSGGRGGRRGAGQPLWHSSATCHSDSRQRARTRGCRTPWLPASSSRAGTGSRRRPWSLSRCRRGTSAGAGKGSRAGPQHCCT